MWRTEEVAARRPATRASGGGPARAAGDEQLSRVDRVARGKERPGGGPAGVRTRSSPRPGTGIRSACCWNRRRSPVPELVPVRHGRMLVLQRSRTTRAPVLPMAADLAHHAHLGAAGTAVRDAHLSSFGAFRLAGAQPGLQRGRTSTRPCPARSVGCGAAGREHGCSRARQQVPRQDLPARSALAAGEGFRTAIASFAQTRPSWTSGTRTWTSTQALAQFQSQIPQGEKVQRKPRSSWPRRTPATP